MGETTLPRAHTRTVELTTSERTWLVGLLRAVGGGEHAARVLAKLEGAPAPTPATLREVDAPLTVEVATTPQTLRVRAQYGACRELGPFLRETATRFYYREESTGRERWIAKRRRSRRYVGERPAQPHVEPCDCCTDGGNHYGRPDVCSIHGGRLVEGFGCETCRST